MNYTHFWRLNEKGCEKCYKLGLLSITNLIDSSFMIVGNSRGDPNSSPYTKDSIIFNGIAPFDNELFYLPKSLKSSSGIYSCNTRGHLYDDLVMASLVILQDYLGNDIKIYSERDKKAWSSGICMAGGLNLRLCSWEELSEDKF